jgi:hypothetical protein
VGLVQLRDRLIARRARQHVERSGREQRRRGQLGQLGTRRQLAAVHRRRTSTLLLARHHH